MIRFGEVRAVVTRADTERAEIALSIDTESTESQTQTIDIGYSLYDSAGRRTVCDPIDNAVAGKTVDTLIKFEHPRRGETYHLKIKLKDNAGQTIQEQVYPVELSTLTTSGHP